MIKKTTKKENDSLKNSIVSTPKIVSDDIYKELSRKNIHNILDIGCYDGALTKSFKNSKKKNLKIYGVDVLDDYKDNFDGFVHKDFLETTTDDFKDMNIDICISNPPFNKHPEHNELYPMLFIEHIQKIFGNKMPIVVISGSWLLSNSYKRMDKLNQLNITKITTIHKNIFKIDEPDVIVEACILYINIKTKVAQSFLGQTDIKEVKGKRRTIYFTKEQEQYLADNKITNFSKFVKGCIETQHPEFPNKHKYTFL